MKSALVLLSFCTLMFLPASNTQTKRDKIQLLPYRDPDGYEVLSTIIDGRAKKLMGDSVSIFHQTISEQSLSGVRFQCSGSIPLEFQKAAEDFDRNAKTKFVLRREFSIKKPYVLVAWSRTNTSPAGQPQRQEQAGVFSVSPVGFDETRTHAIALIQYIVSPPGSVVIGGSRLFYFLRKTDKGWTEDTEIRKCGRIY